MSPISMPADPDALVVAVGPAGRTGQYLQVRVSLDAAPELLQLMKAQDIYAGSAIRASASAPELVALLASVAGGLGGLAAVLRAIFHRHQHRAVFIERDGTTYELKGMSGKETEALIQSALRRAAQDQADSEHLYRGIPGADDDQPT